MRPVQLPRVARYAIDAYWRFNRNDGWAYASHVALSVLLSVFPFFVMTTAIAALSGSGVLGERLVALAFNALPEEIAKPIASEVTAVIKQSTGRLLTISSLVSLYFASNG